MEDEDKTTRQVILNLRAQFQNAEQAHEIDSRRRFEELRKAKFDADLSEVVFWNSMATVYKTMGRKDLESGVLEKLNAIASRNS